MVLETKEQSVGFEKSLCPEVTGAMDGLGWEVALSSDLRFKKTLQSAV